MLAIVRTCSAVVLSVCATRQAYENLTRKVSWSCQPHVISSSSERSTERERDRERELNMHSLDICNQTSLASKAKESELRARGNSIRSRSVEIRNGDENSCAKTLACSFCRQRQRIRRKPGRLDFNQSERLMMTTGSFNRRWAFLNEYNTTHQMITTTTTMTMPTCVRYKREKPQV